MEQIVIMRSGQPHFNLNERGNRVVESASLNKSILSDDSISWTIKSNSVLDIKINDYIEIKNSIYRINTLPGEHKISEKQYIYEIQTQGLMFDLLRCRFFNADISGFKTDDGFSLTGTIEDFLKVIQYNMIRFSDLWTVGAFQNDETKTLTFSEDNCLSALQKICAEFKIEFWIKSQNGKFTINTGDFGNTLPLTLQYGKGLGLYDLSRKAVDETSIINRLYVFGSDKNIPTNYRNFSKNLKPFGVEYIEDAALIQSMGLKEGVMIIDDIFPHRTGTVTAEGIDKFTFSDDTMDFDLNEKKADGITTKYLIAGVIAKIHFNTGNLAGYEFEINSYDTSTKSFKINQFTDGSGYKFPNTDSEAFQFKLGDEYVIIDITMPDIYIDIAEKELLEKGKEQFELKKQAKVTYELIVAQDFMKNLGDNMIEIGDYVRIYDAEMFIDKVLRVNQISNNFIQNNKPTPYQYTLTIADTYEISYASQLILEVGEIKNVVTYNNSQNNIKYQNGYRRLNELKDLTFDPDGYFDPENIKPGSIETNMLSVGARSQQLTLEGVVIEPTYLSDPNAIYLGEGKLKHFSIDPDNIKEWDFESKIVDTLNPDAAYYIYAKCEISSLEGEFVVIEDQLKFDELPNFYHFLIGVLHKENNDFRYYTPLEGATMINGRYITTGKVQSTDLSTWFDLDASVFSLNDIGGMTGKVDLVEGVNSVLMWGGATYEDRYLAPFRIHQSGKIAMEMKTQAGGLQGMYFENGNIIWRDSDGRIRRTIGWQDGFPIDKSFSPDGTLLYEFDSYGFHVYAIPEGFIATEFYNLSNADILETDANLKAIITSSVSKTGGKKQYQDEDGIWHMYWEYILTLNKNYDCWKYQPGNVNPDNIPFAGYKTTNTDKTLNIPNGWYVSSLGEIARETFATGSQPVTGYVQTIFIEDGKIIQNKNLIITK